MPTVHDGVQFCYIVKDRKNSEKIQPGRMTTTFKHSKSPNLDKYYRNMKEVNIKKYLLFAGTVYARTLLLFNEIRTLRSSVAKHTMVSNPTK